MNAARDEEGQFHTIMDKLYDDPKKFYEYFRMSQQTFQELLDLLEPHITKKDTNMRKSISAKQRLAITHSRVYGPMGGPMGQ